MGAKFANSGMNTLSGFVRAMIFEGYIVHIDENELKRLNVLANNIANNINQIAHRANVTQKVYKEDIEDIKSLADQLIQPLLFLQSKCLQLRHWQKNAVRRNPDSIESQYVRYELDWLLKLLRSAQEWLQLFRKAGPWKNYGIYCIYNNDLEVHSYVENTWIGNAEVTQGTTVCNGKREVWTDYEQAKAYFLELMMTTEGEERDRAECVYIQILHGLDECSDEDE